MNRTASLIREARRAAGLSQQSLATRMGTTQSSIAQLESDRSNPRISTLERALRACGQELTLDAHRRNSSIDETLVAAQLRIPPGERLKAFEQSYANVRAFALAAAESRGDVA